jgi:branched-chain amino acid transport system permease protein
MSGLRTYYLGWGIAAMLLLLLPQFLPLIYVHLATEILIYALFAVSFNLLFGYGGLLPFGHVALFGVGAYVTAVILKHFPSMYLLLTFLMAALSGAAIAAIIGFFCLRLKGAYFALISLAFQMFLYAIAMKWRSLAYGDDGMTVNRPDLYLPVLGSVSMRSIPNVYYFTLVIVAMGILACYLFLKTPLGNALVCMREKDIRASYLGYDVFLTRFTVFSASGILAGLAGGLFVFFEEFVATSCIDLNMGISVVFMTVIGGPAHYLGPVLGAAFYMFFQDWISGLTKHWWILMGIVFVVVVLFFEGGLISLFKNGKIRVWIRGLKGRNGNAAIGKSP